MAASPLKSRGAITESESRRLEGLRLKLRSALALRSRLSALSEAEASLKKIGAEPGVAELLLSVSRLREGLAASAYPAARAELAAAADALDAALLKAGAGDLSGALSGLEMGWVEAAAAAVRSASSFNRGAQFFLWGLLFRPVEFKVSAGNGRAVFSPALTIWSVYPVSHGF